MDLATRIRDGFEQRLYQSVLKDDLSGDEQDDVLSRYYAYLDTELEYLENDERNREKVLGLECIINWLQQEHIAYIPAGTIASSVALWSLGVHNIDPVSFGLDGSLRYGRDGHMHPGAIWIPDRQRDCLINKLKEWQTPYSIKGSGNGGDVANGHTIIRTSACDFFLIPGMDNMQDIVDNAYAENAAPLSDALSLQTIQNSDYPCNGDTHGLFADQTYPATCPSVEALMLAGSTNDFTDFVNCIALSHYGVCTKLPQYFRNKYHNKTTDAAYALIEPYFNETYGALLFHEQTLHILRDIAGYSTQEAEAFRRAMQKRITHEFNAERTKLISRLTNRCGFEESEAHNLCAILSDEAHMTLPKAHAVSIATTCYRLWRLQKHSNIRRIKLLNE